MRKRNCHISNVILFYGKFIHISSIHLYLLVKFTSISFRVKLTGKIPFFCTDIEFSQSCCTENLANKLRLLKESKRTSKLKKNARVRFSQRDPIILSWLLLSAHYDLFKSQRRLLLAYSLTIHYFQMILSFIIWLT